MTRMIVQDDLIQALEQELSGNANALRELKRQSGLPLEMLHRALVGAGHMEASDFLQVVCNARNVPFAMDLSGYQADEVLIGRLGMAYFADRELLPVIDSGGRRLLAGATPFDADSLAEVRFLGRYEVEALGCPAPALRRAIAALHENPNDVQESERPGHSSAPEAESDIARGLDALVTDALEAGASDIHLEPDEASLVARFRIHGVLRRHTLPAHLDQSALIARLKLLSGMNVSERRLPQDGRVMRVFGGRKVELRVSSLPTVRGESLVCRVLDPKALRLGWDKLGFEKNIQAQLLGLLAKPYGLFIISGPTASGKTTTLYTALTHLNDGKQKIISVEDPVEYDLPGIEQVQVNAAAGADFATILRATLRHDPDILMIGEIRDKETAEIACRAALVGRLVLATIHANTARNVVDRLHDLGISPALVDQTLIAALEQRLDVVRCPTCGGEGCDDCGHSGTVGRRLRAALVAF